jgi:hypothetical protein
VSHNNGASTNLVTYATILNIGKIRIKNDTTVIVNNLPNRYKLYGQIGNKRNIKNIKIVRTKSAMLSNRKRGSIGKMNSGMAIRKTQRKKMGGMRSHMVRSTRIKIT